MLPITSQYHNQSHSLGGPFQNSQLPALRAFLDYLLPLLNPEVFRPVALNCDISVDSGIEESMRLNCSMLNKGFISGMQAEMMLRLAEALSHVSSGRAYTVKITYCPHITGSTLNPVMSISIAMWTSVRQERTGFIRILKVLSEADQLECTGDAHPGSSSGFMLTSINEGTSYTIRTAKTEHMALF